jgi:hypothetical protein
MRFPLAAVALLIASVAAWPAAADPGKGKHNGNSHGGNPHAGGPDNSQASVPAFVVRDNDRQAISGYYRDEFARGNCPPGLAKKNNGCLPPGQAKKLWALGQPLPPNVVYYPLPQPLYGRLAPPPSGYDYVRVQDDVLMMDRRNRSIVSIVVNLR